MVNQYFPNFAVDKVTSSKLFSTSIEGVIQSTFKLVFCEVLMEETIVEIEIR